jgi:hypothetical protein
VDYEQQPAFRKSSIFTDKCPVIRPLEALHDLVFSVWKMGWPIKDAAATSFEQSTGDCFDMHCFYSMFRIYAGSGAGE